jgi:poly(3-hydroxybutyrate) depolymerase
MESSGFKQVADAEGFLVAYPDGIDSAWNIGPCCTFSRDVDDVAFARAIIKQIQSEANVDEARVYAAGFSNGGGMTQYLACHAADLFAAVAPSAFDLLEENSPSCSPARPIPILLTRALDDNFVTYAGGPSNPPNGLATTIHFMGATATFNRWAKINHCSNEIIKDEFGCEIHTSCDAQVAVGLCSVPHKGHTPADANISWMFLKRFKKQ